MRNGNQEKNILKAFYFLSDINWYELGAIIKKIAHQIVTRKANVKVIKILLNKIQLRIKVKIPKVIIDQGWHQKGFKSQNCFLEFESIR